MKDHIVDFESKWTSLASRTNQSAVTDTNKLAFALKPFFQSSEIKASLLLGSLPDTMNNIVENLQTKDNLTYELAYNHLMDLRSSSDPNLSSTETAYKAANQLSKTYSQSRAKVCTYCQKKGHLWGECRARKRKEKEEKKEKQKKESSKKKSSEQAKVGDSDESETALTVHPSPSLSFGLSASTWVLDSGATSHMTSDPGCFTSIREKEGFVKIGDGSRIKIEGVGEV